MTAGSTIWRMARNRTAFVFTLSRSAFFVILGFVLAAAVNYFLPTNILLPPVHWHADMAIFINGQKISLSDGKYMDRDEAIHLHDTDASMLHIHQAGATLGEFFQSLNGELTATCLKFDEASFCNSLLVGLKIYVNGQRIWHGGQYQPSDLDRSLVSFGPWLSDRVTEQVQVSDRACIYSQSCPERGLPPREACGGDKMVPCVTPGQSL